MKPTQMIFYRALQNREKLYLVAQFFITLKR